MPLFLDTGDPGFEEGFARLLGQKREDSPDVDAVVSEIIAVAPGEEQTGYAVTHVFKADPGTTVARPHVLPDDYRDLSRFGFDLAAFTQAQDGTGA